MSSMGSGSSGNSAGGSGNWEGVQHLLALLSDPQDYQAKLDAFRAQEDAAKQAIVEADARKREADAAGAEARDAIAEVKELMAELAAKRNEFAQQQAEATAQAATWEKHWDDREAKVAKREKDSGAKWDQIDSIMEAKLDELKRRESDVVVTEMAAQEIMKTARAMDAEYRAKLEKLRSLTA